jgi:hypothetical protein
MTDRDPLAGDDVIFHDQPEDEANPAELEEAKRVGLIGAALPQSAPAVGVAPANEPADDEAPPRPERTDA